MSANCFQRLKRGNRRLEEWTAAHPWLAISVWAVFILIVVEALDVVFHHEGNFVDRLFSAIGAAVGAVLVSRSRRSPRRSARQFPTNKTRPISIRDLRLIFFGGFLLLLALFGLIVWAAAR